MRKHDNPEEREQKLVVAYIRRAYPKALFTCSPAGFKMPKLLSIMFAKWAYAMGYRKGVSDLIIFEARKGCHGLFIEMKSATGRPTDEQKVFLDMVGARGYANKVCKSFEEAITLLDWYMGGVS